MSVRRRGYGKVLIIAMIVVAGFIVGTRLPVAAHQWLTALETWNSRSYAYGEGGSVLSFDGAIDLERLPPGSVPEGAWSMTVAVVVLGGDWNSCEDLGRQLRVLRSKAADEGIPMVFWTDPSSFARTEIQLRREGLGRETLAEVSTAEVLPPNIQTPAALLIQPDGRIVSGVSHDRRARNVRAVSFAQEIVWPDAIR